MLGGHFLRSTKRPLPVIPRKSHTKQARHGTVSRRNGREYPRIPTNTHEYPQERCANTPRIPTSNSHVFFERGGIVPLWRTFLPPAESRLDYTCAAVSRNSSLALVRDQEKCKGANVQRNSHPPESDRCELSLDICICVPRSAA